MHAVVLRGSPDCPWNKLLLWHSEINELERKTEIPSRVTTWSFLSYKPYHFKARQRGGDHAADPCDHVSNPGDHNRSATTPGRRLRTRHHADDPVGPGASDPVDPGASDLPPLATTQLATVNPTWVRPDWTCQHKSADASGHVRGSGHLAGDPSNAHPRKLLSRSLSRRSRGDKHEVSKLSLNSSFMLQIASR